MGRVNKKPVQINPKWDLLRKKLESKGASKEPSYKLMTAKESNVLGKRKERSAICTIMYVCRYFKEHGWPSSTILDRPSESDTDRAKLIDTIQDWKTERYQEIIKSGTVEPRPGVFSFKLAAPVECKGIVGSDDRHYLLDLMRVTPRDANYTGAGSRFCILRPELIAAYCQAKAIEQSKLKGTQEEASTISEAPKVEDATTHAELKEDVVNTIESQVT